MWNKTIIFIAYVWICFKFDACLQVSSLHSCNFRKNVFDLIKSIVSEMHWIFFSYLLTNEVDLQHNIAT